jgi:hypothetical protein
VLFAHYCAGDKIKKNDMSGVSRTDGGGEVCTEFWWANLSERDNWENPDVDGIITLR